MLLLRFTKTSGRLRLVEHASYGETISLRPQMSLTPCSELRNRRIHPVNSDDIGRRAAELQLMGPDDLVDVYQKALRRPGQMPPPGTTKSQAIQLILDAEIAAATGMPKETKGIVYGLLAIGVCGLLFSANKAWGAEPNDQNAVRVAAFWSVIGLAAAVMIWMRIPGAKQVAVVYSLPLIIAFPLGTFIAWKIISEVCSDPTLAYLSNRKASNSP